MFDAVMKGARVLDDSGTAFGIPQVYVGPGDVVSTALAWWGLRAYSAATAGNKAINLRRDSDNATQDFSTLGSGTLDITSITTFKGAANLFVTKMYDQTGNGHDAVQATAANQPTFTLNNFGTFPTADGGGSTNLFLATAANFSVQVQPITLSKVIIWTTTGVGTWFGQLSDFSSFAVQISRDLGVTNNLSVYAGTASINYNFSTGSWHAAQITLEHPTTNFYVDGTNQAGGDAGSSAIDNTNGHAYFLGNGQGSSWGGSMVEYGIWTIAFSGTQNTNMNSNQHSYWRF